MRAGLAPPPAPAPVCVGVDVGYKIAVSGCDRYRLAQMGGLLQYILPLPLLSLTGTSTTTCTRWTMGGNAGAFVSEDAETLSLLEEEADTPRFVPEDVAGESAVGNGTCFGVCAMSVACVCGFRPGGIQEWEGRCWTTTTTTVAGGVPVKMC